MARSMVASSPGPILILKLAGTKNRAWNRLARSWCACASHSPESGESCTVVLWFVIFSVYLFGSPRKLYLVVYASPVDLRSALFRNKTKSMLRNGDKERVKVLQDLWQCCASHTLGSTLFYKIFEFRSCRKAQQGC